MYIKKFLIVIIPKKNRFFTIKAAVIYFVILYMIRNRILKPPKSLRHIPYQGYFDLFKLIIGKESYWDYTHRLVLPLINSKQSNGIYLEPGTSGWEVHIANPQVAKQILQKHEMFPKVNFKNILKDTLAGKFSAGSNMVFLNGHEWKSQRAIVNPAFHRSMPVRLFGELACKLIRVMETMDETVTDFTDLMERLTLDAIGRAGFGFDFHSIEDRDNKWTHIYKDISVGMQDPLYLLFPKLETDKIVWLIPKRWALHRKMDDFLKMLDEIIIAKRNSLKENKVYNTDLEENEKDLLTLMLEDESNTQGTYTNKELKNNLCLFFLAGHDTTANALSFAVYFLAKHPDIQQKAREEAIRVLGNEPKDITPFLEQIKRLVYLNQVIKETLRIFGPVVQTIPRVAHEDIVFLDTFIPKGTPIVVDIFNIQHCEKFWKNAEEFNPDRFADPVAHSTTAMDEGFIHYLPFGYGARQCLGIKFSLNEQLVLLSMLLRKFTWKIPENSIHKDKLNTAGSFFIGPHILDMVFKKRY
ncbi:cytochrome P450 [Cokeromyces recurvatus]|uniref:cytochrome P450 n=1 Tax=Cokeromyces recurvatus TaxID=90255 RepID=UPI00221E97A7|nr:cytochrome P450 [Cokeromyces recurvatus]KAI7905066.1 cytochrome P450 [Cokeromyces recurvatus]